MPLLAENNICVRPSIQTEPHINVEMLNGNFNNLIREGGGGVFCGDGQGVGCPEDKKKSRNGQKHINKKIKNKDTSYFIHSRNIVGINFSHTS